MVCSNFMSDPDAREKRARARGSWPVVRADLSSQPEADLSSLSMSERLALVWQLTLDAWAMTGREIPAYERSQMPGTVVRRGNAS
jgi:hypothetical protein